MSELKSYDLVDIQDYRGEVYLKSKADKVIAEKDKELRHHKYKRCVAMARLCHERSLWWYSKGYGFEKYDKFWEKWEKRWLELAEKFKGVGK